MDREYFSVELSTGIDLALSLTDMKVVAQFEAKNICIVPGVADFWYGVTNFKGSLIWVLNSDRFLNGATRQRPEGTLHPKGAVSLMGYPPCEGATPKTALHRFFQLDNDRQPKKLTSVILHQQQAQKKVAIVTHQLKGIISIRPDCLKPIKNDTSILSKCCSAIVETEELSTYIIKPAALLDELQKRSLLVSS